MKTKKIIGIGIVIVVICIFLCKNNKNLKEKSEEELIFFKWFSIANDTEKYRDREKQQTYIFKVGYRNIDFKEIYLADTINKETLIREKIAPRNERKI